MEYSGLFHGDKLIFLVLLHDFLPLFQLKEHQHRLVQSVFEREGVILPVFYYSPVRLCLGHKEGAVFDWGEEELGVLSESGDSFFASYREAATSFWCPLRSEPNTIPVGRKVDGNKELVVDLTEVLVVD